MSDQRPAFYAAPGSTGRDLVALLHLPYTVWHLSYVAIGAGLAPRLDGGHLAGTLLAFAFGLGVGAHALDELRNRPLRTAMSNKVLLALGVGGLAAAAGVAVAGSVVISPWVLAWAAAGIALATGYALEWPARLHSMAGFAATWGAFPVLVGYWAQAEGISPAAIAAAAAAAAIAVAQRRLSTPARFVRRETAIAQATFDDAAVWDRAALLATWEGALRALAWAMPALALALVLRPH